MFQCWQYLLGVLGESLSVTSQLTVQVRPRRERLGTRLLKSMRLCVQLSPTDIWQATLDKTTLYQFSLSSYLFEIPRRRKPKSTKRRERGKAIFHGLSSKFFLNDDGWFRRSISFIIQARESQFLTDSKNFF